MEAEGKDTVCLTFQIVVAQSFYPMLEELKKNARIEVSHMLADRTKSSSKYYPLIPCILSKSLITKYQKNKRLKRVRRLVLPVCGDKGKQVKIEGNGIRIPGFFKKEIIAAPFPHPVVGYIRQVEFFKRDGIWLMSYSYNVLCAPPQNIVNAIGVDRNSVENVAVIANPLNGEVRKFGLDMAGLKKNFGRRKANLQSKGAKRALKKLKRKQSRRTRDINHKVSRSIVVYASEHRSAIVLEDLANIRKGKARRYVEKSQWSFYQLQEFIRYKAALRGIPVRFVDPRYTSKGCSRCGQLNTPNGKRFKCSGCGHVDHRDANAAFNIALRYLRHCGDGVSQTELHSANTVGHIGGPLNQRVVRPTQLESSGGAR